MCAAYKDSDNESYVQRDLLSPDEIPQAVKPKGRTKKYGGSCIVIVDEFKPMYFPKYDTKSHSLFSVTGSSFPNGVPNNTYIEKTYADHKAERHTKHQQKLKDFFAEEKDRNEQAEAEYQAEQTAAEQAEQDRLSEMFDENDFKDADSNQEEIEEFIENGMSEDVPPIEDVAPIMDIFDNGDDE